MDTIEILIWIATAVLVVGKIALILTLRRERIHAAARETRIADLEEQVDSLTQSVGGVEPWRKNVL